MNRRLKNLFVVRDGSVLVIGSSVVDEVVVFDVDNGVYLRRSMLGLDEYLRFIAFFTIGSVVVNMEIDGVVAVVVGRRLRFGWYVGTIDSVVGKTSFETVVLTFFVVNAGRLKFGRKLGRI